MFPINLLLFLSATLFSFHFTDYYVETFTGEYPSLQFGPYALGLFFRSAFSLRCFLNLEPFCSLFTQWLLELISPICYHYPSTSQTIIQSSEAVSHYPLPTAHLVTVMWNKDECKYSTVQVQNTEMLLRCRHQSVG